MKTVLALLLLVVSLRSPAQEASSGFELRTTLSTQVLYAPEMSDPPRSGTPAAAGFRAVLYPTWKISRNWTFSGAVQVYSRPYFLEQRSTQGYGLKTDVLQANLSYSRIGVNRSIVVRAGQMSTAFGAFLLRYDDAVNPLAGMPLSYGYYYKGVSSLGMMGAEVDATFHRFDGRVQFVNSSPANRRGIFDSDQYGNWAAGAGYTILQGFRIGVSGYRGPYLHRRYRYYFKGEAPPKDLPATAYGVDVQYGHGKWNVDAEFQHFLLTYQAIANLREHTAYAEVRRSLTPRWYVAARAGYVEMSSNGRRQGYETAIGYRINESQLLKASWEVEHPPGTASRLSHTAALQFVMSLKPISLAAN